MTPPHPAGQNVKKEHSPRAMPDQATAALAPSGKKAFFDRVFDSKPVQTIGRAFDRMKNTAVGRTIGTAAGRIWKHIGQPGRLAVGTAVFTVGVAIPGTGPVILMGAAMMVKESPRLQRWLTGVRARHPQTSAYIDEKMQSFKRFGLVRDLFQLTNPAHAAMQANQKMHSSASAPQTEHHTNPFAAQSAPHTPQPQPPPQQQTSRPTAEPAPTHATPKPNTPQLPARKLARLAALQHHTGKGKSC